MRPFAREENFRGKWALAAWEGHFIDGSWVSWVLRISNLTGFF